MKKIISLLLTLALCVSCAVLLASCGGAPEDDGAHVKVYLGEEVYDYDFTDYYVSANQEALMSLLFEPLFKLSDRGELLKEGAAKNYKIDEEARQIVIELRETYWSDDKRVTADDFIYAWRNILLNPTNATPAAALLYDIENAVEVKRGNISIYDDLGVEKTDTYEITITYREGGNPETLLKNLASIATAPVRQDVYENASGYWTKVLNYAMTNGPFEFDEIDYTNGKFTLARNVGYHQALDVEDYTKQVTPGKLVTFVSPAAVTVSYAEIEAKTTFYMSDASLAERAANKKKADVADALSTYTYVFNTEKAAFAKPEVRRALSMAIDRSRVVADITFGKAATGFLPDTVDIKRENDLIASTAKLDEAKALVAAAGLSPEDMKITLTVDDAEDSVKIANIVKEAWTALGFEVAIDAVGFDTPTIVDFKTNEDITIRNSKLQSLAKAASKGERSFDVIAIDWQMYSSDAFVALCGFSSNFNGNGTDFKESGAYVSIGGWKNDTYDALIAEAYATTDKATRAAKLAEAEAILINEGVVAPIVYNQNFAFVARELRGTEFDAFGNPVFTKVKQKNYREYIAD